MLVTAAAAITAATAGAYDFMADGIAYNINADGMTATVTYSNYGNNYAGVTTIAVPERAVGKGKEYKVTAIGDYAFNECASLKTLSMPATVTSIGEYAAFGCTRMTTLAIGTNVRSIGRYAFAEVGIASLELPSAVSTVGNYAFSSCPNLSTVNTGNGVVKIGTSCFRDCASMTGVTLGVKVTTIGNTAFAGCYQLGRITCGMTTPPEISDDVFEGVSRTTCRLIVPSGTLELYGSAEVWRTFIRLTDNNTGYALNGNDIDHVRGDGYATLSLDLDNAETVTTVRFDLEFPSGVSLAQQGGDYLVTLDDNRRSRNHSISVTASGDRCTVLISSPTNNALRGNEGTLVTMKLKVDGNAHPGTIYLKNASVAQPSGQVVNLLNTSVKLSMYYLRGDTDADGVVDVADYQNMAIELLRSGSSKRFFADAADVNQNGTPDVGDLVMIVQRALNVVKPELVKMW